MEPDFMPGSKTPEGCPPQPGMARRVEAASGCEMDLNSYAMPAGTRGLFGVAAAGHVALSHKHDQVNGIGHSVRSFL